MVNQEVGQFDDRYYTDMYGGKRWKSKIGAMIKDQEVYVRGRSINNIRPAYRYNQETVRDRVDKRIRIKKSYGYNYSNSLEGRPRSPP